MAKSHSMPFFLSEYNDGLGFGCCHDRSYAAAFLAHHALLWQNESLIDHSYFAGISYWTFSDIFEELYMDKEPFHNGYGLLTVDLIPKPAFRMFEVLAKFPSVFFRNVAGSTWENVTSFSGIKNETESFVHIETICTQFVPGSSSVLRQTRTNISIEYDYNIDHSSGKSASSSTIRCELSVAAIDSQHTNPLETWKAMHSPSPIKSSFQRNIIKCIASWLGKCAMHANVRQWHSACTSLLFHGDEWCRDRRRQIILLRLLYVCVFTKCNVSREENLI